MVLVKGFRRKRNALLKRGFFICCQGRFCGRWDNGPDLVTVDHTGDIRVGDLGGGQAGDN
jgi:hypothetical protein